MTLQEQNSRLADMLRGARDQGIMLRFEVDRLSRPPRSTWHSGEPCTILANAHSRWVTHG